MAKRLREVSEQRPGPRVDLLRKKAQVVRGLGVRHKHALRFVDLPRHCEHLRQPESTKNERSLLAADAVVGSVAIHVRAGAQLGADPLHRPKHPIVVWRQEPVNRKQEQGRIRMLVVIRRHEALCGAV